MTHIFDLDGTVLKFHTNEWLPGAKEMLESCVLQGDLILFITARGIQDRNTEWSIEKTEELLKGLNLPYRIVYGVESPRILYDDDFGSISALHPRDGAWKWKE